MNAEIRMLELSAAGAVVWASGCCGSSMAIWVTSGSAVVIGAIKAVFEECSSAPPRVSAGYVVPLNTNSDIRMLLEVVVAVVAAIPSV